MSIRSVLLVAAVALATASPFDPHMPSGSTYFDGWFFRMLDHSTNTTFAVVTGTFLSGPPGAAAGSAPTWYALLYHDTVSGSTCISQGHLQDNEVSLTRGGRPITSDPVPEAPSKFEWTSSTVGKIEIDGDGGSLSLKFPPFTGSCGAKQGKDGVLVDVKLAGRQPWDPKNPNTGGPEGIFRPIDFVLPCHYYVHSLGSPASYEVTFPTSGSQVRQAPSLSGKGYVHMETNYGSHFPSGWVWVQGIGQRDGAAADTGRAALVMTGGLFEIGPVTTHTWVIGYHSDKTSFDFRTTELSNIKHDWDACGGVLNVSATGVTHIDHLEVTVTADPRSFSDPLFVPTPTGFANSPGCVESYGALGRVTAMKAGRVVETATFVMCALEFGGSYRCDA